MGKGPGWFFSYLGVTRLSDKAFLLLAIMFASTLVCLLMGAQTAFYLRRISPAVDVAGRQRMLTQHMLARGYMVCEDPARAAQEGARSVREFEEALLALKQGGMAAGVKLAPAPRETLAQLAGLEAAWGAFEPDLLWLLANPGRHGDRAFKEALLRATAAAERQLEAAQAFTAALRGAAMRRVRIVLAIFLILTGAVGLIFHTALSSLKRHLLAPLEELSCAAADLGAGKRPRLRQEEREDEIGELQRVFDSLAATVTRDRDARAITATLLELGIGDDPPDAFLEKALQVILAIPWLCAEPRGAVFLYDEKTGALEMKAQRGLHAALTTACAGVPSGRCLCGRAAAAGTIVFAAEVDERHEITYDGIKPHGHYCVPMKYGGRLIGVLNLYLDEGHRKDDGEVSQLENIAGLLAAIVEKKRLAAESLKMAEIIRQASDTVFITDVEGRITYVNEAFEKATGFRAAEAVGRTPNLLKSGEHPPEYYTGMWTSMQKGIPWSGRITNKRKDGGLYTVQANIFPLKSRDGRSVSYVSIQQDVSALTLMEDQLRQSQKMEAVGRLAGGVAHDFNNILMAIDSYVRFLSPALAGNRQAEEDLGEIRKSVARAADITRQLLAFSRKQKAVLQPLDLGAAVRANAKMLARLLGEGVDLRLNAADTGASIKADLAQLDQLLMNLLVNARDAMPGGGSVSVDALRQVLPAPSASAFGEIPAGEYAVLSVHDSGCGMDADTLRRIFDPFFTTKPKGKGTGLGLSIVHGIVAGHGAHITVASRPGQGTTFTVYFPLVGDAPEPDLRASAAAPAALPPGTTVLLAEDDPVVIASLTRTLRALGADVRPFTNPAALLDFAAGFRGPLPLLLTDIVMPGMDGFTLAEKVTGLFPSTKVIYMSGYTDPDVFKGRLEQPGILFLYKPFGPEQLERVIRAALAAGMTKRA